MTTYLKAFGFGIVLALVALGAYLQFGSTASEDLPAVTVYKSPTCGCCAKWATHLREEGFSVDVQSRMNVQPIKRELGVPGDLAACHTATVGGYVVEGHVPAREVKRLLREQPEVTGLGVPGMPIGSPGMERGDRVEPYTVHAFTSSGETEAFATYGEQPGGGGR